MTNDVEKRLIRDLYASTTTDERACMRALEQASHRKMEAFVSELAEKAFGVIPGAPDSQCTQFPVLFGVIRGTLKAAYDAGCSRVAADMIESIARAEARGAPPPPNAEPPAGDAAP